MNTPPRVIEPQVERRQIKVPRIRSQDVELGLFYVGRCLSRTSAPTRLRGEAAYHVTEDFFFQAEAGRSQGGRTSFETLSGYPAAYRQ